MTALLTILIGALSLGVALFVPAHGPSAVLLCAALALPVSFIIRREKEHGNFLLRIFAAGLLTRMLVGTVIFMLGLQSFFGGDAITYDYQGLILLKFWEGETFYRSVLERYSVGGGWGMSYLVAAVYAIVGRNLLAVQYVNCIIGAATAPVIFLCAKQIFQNGRVAHIAGTAVAVFPSLVLWSSQGLKDGPIVFLLAVCMLATLKLGDKFSLAYLVVLICALFGILSLRFYIFYMLVAAIGGAFIIGLRPATAQGLLRQFVIVICVGLAMMYLGVLRTASVQLETYGSLERVQTGRLDLAQSAQSGFAKDIDVSTTSGALSAIPIGMTYLLFAPFPWQLASLRQSITVPEMLVWWASFPLLILGLWFTLKFRLRQALPILMFTAMLTFAYSIFQGNVGTAYRQRSQLLIFYFIFVAVGFVLVKERREDRRR